MKLETVRQEAEKIWNTRDSSKLLDYLYENRAVFADEDTSLGYTYFLSAVDKDNLENYGRHGILFSADNLQDSLRNVSSLRRAVHRIEWCEETDPSSIISLMKNIGATAIDLNWIIKASTLDSEYVLGRISGRTDNLKKTEPQPYYYDPDASYNGAQVAFVICSNDEEELAEAEYYISRLFVPEGCEVSVLSILDAKSICSGYNEAIDASDAMYKVYMHHDVRILDRFFIYYILKIFSDDPQIGMIGMIGTKGLPKEGIMWDEDRFGAWIESHVHTCVSLSRYPSEDTTEIGLADGFLLATQKDLRWRDDLFDGWDFYDASQCMEFHNRGYKVVVPYQEKPWCLHDCGYWNLDKHDEYREIFMKNYFSDTNRRNSS